MGPIWPKRPMIMVWRGLDGEGEVYLVVERDSVAADGGDRGFFLAGAVDRAGAKLREAESATLVEAERVDVVVGGGEADLPTAAPARLADGRLDEQGSDPDTTLDGVERDYLQHVARDVIGKQPGQAAGSLGDEAGQLGGLEDGAVHGHGLRSPQLGDQPGQHRAVALADRPDPDPRLLHPVIIPAIILRLAPAAGGGGPEGLVPGAGGKIGATAAGGGAVAGEAHIFTCCY